MPKPKSSLQIQKLEKNFGEKAVLRGVSLEVYPGEVLALTGENGSGKTTLLKILTTLMIPTQGDAWIGGHSVTREPQAVRSLLGWMAASDRGFIPRFTGRENLDFFGSLQGIESRGVEDRIEELRTFQTLQNALETPFYLCSAGMKQALHLARASLADPPFIFFDEPSRSLDKQSLDFLKRYILSKAQTKTILFTTHSLDYWPDFPGRKIELKDGAVQPC